MVGPRIQAEIAGRTPPHGESMVSSRQAEAGEKEKSSHPVGPRQEKR